MEKYLQHMERSPEMRLNTFLYVVRDGTAQEAVSAAGKETGGVVELLTSLEKDVQLMSESHVFTCGETAEQLAEQGACLAAAVRLVHREDILAGEDPVTLAAEGYAILKEGRLAGYLDADLARGVNLLMDLGGEDILAVGSDFDGCKSTVRGLETVGDYGRFADLLRAHGVPENTVHKICYANAAAFFGMSECAKKEESGENKY